MRLFKQHDVRQITSLDGYWEFAFTADERQTPDWNARIAVPGCWEATLEFARKRGVGWYRRRFDIAQKGNYLLAFEGVANDAIVYIDRKEIAHHYGPHTPFQTPSVHLATGEHELMVRVDNRFGPNNTLLLPVADWYCWGGIHRSVSLQRVADVRIESIHARTTELDGSNAIVKITAWLMNSTDTDINLDIDLNIEKLWSEKVKTSIPACESIEIAQTVKLRNITPWSSKTPQLYTLRASCEFDDLIERFGVRTVECRGRDILLNGQPITLRGINHHDYHPESGYTSDLLRMKRDLDLIQSMGLNFVRGSHYPKDQLFLDLCDEMGLLVWEEATGWQNSPEEMLTDTFTEQCTQCIKEMVTEHFNHPCIIMWGMLNEFRSEYNELRPVVKRLADTFHQLDLSRPITYATNRLLDNPDKLLDLIDIISPNLYNRWYESFYGNYSNDPAEYLDLYTKSLDEQGLGEKPIIIGEFGAGALVGNHCLARTHWSEEGQVDILLEAIHAYEANPRVSGYAIWMFADTATGELKVHNRPGGHNCKGIVDRYRNPKMAYYAIKEIRLLSKLSWGFY